MSHPKAHSKTDTFLSISGQGKNEWLVWGKRYLYCVPAWRVTDWFIENSRKASGSDPCCVCTYYILRRHWVMITHGNLKTWMWVVGNVFCFIEITFTILMTLKDYSDVVLHVCDGTELSYIWKCDWNALKSLFFKVYDEMDFVFVFWCLNYIFSFKNEKNLLILFWMWHGKCLIKFLGFIPQLWFSCPPDFNLGTLKFYFKCRGWVNSFVATDKCFKRHILFSPQQILTRASKEPSQQTWN